MSSSLNDASGRDAPAPGGMNPPLEADFIRSLTSSFADSWRMQRASRIFSFDRISARSRCQRSTVLFSRVR